MNKSSEKHIKIKIAISLKTLLENNKSNLLTDRADIATSYNEIALRADLRKATVSDIFNAKSMPSAGTLILILEAMQIQLVDFSKVYDSVTERDIQKFDSNVK